MAKNLGQVAGLFIGTSAPTNTTLIWYDSASHVHKVYNTSLSAWTVLDQQAISDVTYGELVSRAGGTGLTQGQWFKITDRSNALALAITSTKIQYVDNSGALVVDDLGTSVQYHITSGNLLIDDISGVYDTNTGKLVFSFEVDTPSMTTDDENVDYFMGVSKRGTARSLKKWRLSTLLSSNVNNALSWAGGLFLDFGAKLRTYFDTEGGVVSKETFDNFQTTQQQTIDQLAQDELAAIQQAGNKVSEETTAAKIYDKELPITPTSGTPLDIARGDKLSTIIVKIYRWIARFKNSDGINVGATFSPSSATEPSINGSDTVFSALRKVQKCINELRSSEITTSRIADGAVTAPKIAEGAVGSSHIQGGAISTGKIADGAVTSAKLGAGAVTSAKLEDILLPCCHYGTITIDSASAENGVTDFCGTTPITFSGMRFWGIKTLNVNQNCSVDINNFFTSGLVLPCSFVIECSVAKGGSVKVDSFSLLQAGERNLIHGLLAFKRAPSENFYTCFGWEVELGY